VGYRRSQRAWGRERAREGSPSPAGLTRRSLLTIAGAGALAAACGGQAVRTYPPPPLPKGQLYYGSSTPAGTLDSFESALGTRLSCHRTFFSPGGEAALVAEAAADLRDGRLPIPSIKPPASWAETARDDAWLDSLIGPLSDLPGPVYLVIHHEPENDAARFGSSDDFVALQRAALSRADAAGDNVTVVPILTAWSFDERSAIDASSWNVDNAPIYGLDVYNPWSADNGKPWTLFGDRLALSADDAAGRPILIGEYGCRTDPADPGRAAAWMREAFTSSLRADAVAMAYFNSAVGSRDGTWELDDERFPVFSELLRSGQVARV
jgi:hypothetical protein